MIQTIKKPAGSNDVLLCAKSQTEREPTLDKPAWWQFCFFWVCPCLLLQETYLSSCFCLSEESAEQTAFFLQRADDLLSLISESWTSSSTYRASDIFSNISLSRYSDSFVASLMKTHLVLRQAVSAGREVAVQRLCTLKKTKMLLDLCEHANWVQQKRLNSQFNRFKASKGRSTFTQAQSTWIKNHHVQY